MENQQTNPQTMDPNMAPQYQSDQNLPAKNYWKIATIILSILVMALVTGGVYLLSNNQQKSITNLSTPSLTEKSTIEEATPTIKPTVIPAVGNITNWKTQTILIQEESASLGKQTFIIELKIPSDWNMQTYPRQADSNSMIKNCSDYVITSPIVGLSMTLSPICSGWVAKYSSWPTNAVIVLQRKQNGNDGPHNYYRVRYTTTPNNYNYVDGMTDPNRSLDQNKDQVMDAILIGYAPPNESKNDFFFIASHLTATYHPVAGEEEKFLSIADQIASSLSLR